MQRNLPKILRKLRTEHEYSQENIAEELKIDSTTYSRYEKGLSQIKFEHVARLAEFYGLTLDELYHYGDPAYAPAARNEGPRYQKRPKMMVTVELDGLETSLKTLFKRLTAMNQALNQTS